MQSCRSKLTNAWRGARHWRKVGDALKKGKFLHVKLQRSKDPANIYSECIKTTDSGTTTVLAPCFTPEAERR